MWPDCQHDPTGLALLQGCKDQPHDLERRLILTDWLEDQGETEVAGCLRASIHDLERWIEFPASVRERWAPWNHCFEGWPGITHAREDLPDSAWCCLWCPDLPEPRQALPFINHMARMPQLRHLTCLFLQYGLLGADAVRLLVNSPSLVNLTSLAIIQDALDSEGARAVAQSPYLSRLTRLNLGGNSIGNAGVTALAQSSNLANLEFLWLSECDIEDTGLTALVTSPHSLRLRTLRLEGNRIGPEGMAILAESPHLANLTELSLSGNSIHAAGTYSLANAPALENPPGLTWNATLSARSVPGTCPIRPTCVACTPCAWAPTTLAPGEPTRWRFRPCWRTLPR